MFFRDFDFVVRKTSDILTIRWLDENARPHPKALYAVRLLGDDVCYLDEDNFKEVNESPRSFIAAVVGTVLLEDVCAEDGTEEVDRSSVIAWSFSPAGRPCPVTATGRCEDEFWKVLLPDGTVCGADGRKYPTEQAYRSETGKT